jgi:hypothetical protein
MPTVSRDLPRAPTSRTRTPCVLVVLADQLRGDPRQIEGETVGQIDPGDLPHLFEHRGDVIRQGGRLQIDVSRRPPEVERRQQNSALEHQVISVRRIRDPGKQALEGVERQQFLHIASGGASQSLDREHDVTGRGASSRDRAHSRISNAERIPGNACGNA